MRAHPPADLEAVDAGEADVEDDEAHGVAAQLGDGLLTRAEPENAPPVLLLEVRLDESPDRVLVLDEEKDAPRRRSAGAHSYGPKPSTWIVSAGWFASAITVTRIPRRRAEVEPLRPTGPMTVAVVET